MTELLNTISQHWYDWQIAMLWQTAVLIGILWVIDLIIRKWAWPQVRYVLWMLVLVKLLIPPTWTSPASVTSHIPTMAAKAVSIQFTDTAEKAEDASGRGRINPIVQGSMAPDDEGTQTQSQGFTPRGQAIPVSQNTAEPVDTDVNKAATVMEQLDTGVSSLSWEVYAMGIWLIGITGLSLWLVWRLAGLRKEHVKNNVQAQLPERFDEQLKMTGQKLGLKRLPAVILTDKVTCPAVFGVFCPVLLIPAKKFTSMSHQETEHVLLHELAHIKRGDLLVHAIYMLLQIAYWFNPLLWMIRKTLQNLRELCCDATVAKLLKEDTVHYRQTLLETARRLLAEPVDPGLGLLGLFENSNWLITRLKWLEKKTWKNRRLRIATIVLLVAVMATCVLPMGVFDPGQPEFLIKGTVTDAETGDPIAGAKVGDNKAYNGGEFCTITDSNGDYEYKTWYEEHFVVAEANGYKAESKILLTKLFGSEKERVIDIELKRVSASQTEKVKSWVEDFFKHNYKDISKRKTLEWGDPVVHEDGSISIRYKYEATIWGKDKIIENKVWTFDKNGTFIHVRKVGAENIYSPPGAQALVEDFFANNYRDITVRKTIEWGQPVKNEDDSVSIRYKYEATIRDKDKKINDQIFTFDEYGKFVSAKNADSDMDSEGIGEAVLLPEFVGSQKVLSLKTGQLMLRQQAEELHHPYLSYTYTFPPGQHSSQYTAFTIPEQYVGVSTGSMDIAEGQWAPESERLKNLWSVQTPDQLPDIQPRPQLTYPDGTIEGGIFIGLPQDKQWPYITAFLGDDGTYGVFEITKVQDRKIYVRFKVFQRVDIDDDEEIPTPELRTNNYTATLPNGVTVELVGVCEYPGEGSWWRPDGIIFKPALKIDKREDLIRKKPYAIIFRVSENDFNTRLYAEKLSSYSTLDVFDLQGKKLEGYRAIVSDLQDIEILKRLEIQIASGPWQAIAEYKDRSKFVDNDIVFSEPVSTNFGTQIGVTGDFDWSGTRQFIAFDKEGIKHNGGWAGRSTGNRTISQGRFYGIKPEQITKYQILYRPYEIITFKNVSIRPGITTDVKVEVEKPETDIQNSKTHPANSLSQKFQSVQMVSFKKDMRLSDALRMLSEMYQINVIPSEKTANPRTTIHVTNLYDVTLEDILKALCSNTHQYVIEDNFVYVYTNEEYQAHHHGNKTEMESETPSPVSASQDSEKRIEKRWIRSERPGVTENDNAFMFDGSSNYVRIPESSDLDIKGSLTLSAWVQNHGDNDGQIIWRGDNQGGRDPYELHIANKKMEFRIDPLDGTKSYAVRSGQPVDNNWHLWMGVYDADAGAVYLYKDGQLEAQAQAPTGFNYDTSQMWNMIGAVDFGNWQHFKGVIDEVRIWNRALTQTEILEGVYQSNDPQLVAYWNFNEGQGDVVNDASGHNHHGQLGFWTGAIGYIPPQRQKKVSPLDITPADFKLRFNEEQQAYNLWVSIHNQSGNAIPRHKIRFYRGNLGQNLDETSNPHSGWHEAGPIEPGKIWNEHTRDFYLPDGDYTFTVVLDYDNAIKETDETNNSTTLKVTIKDGKIIER